MRLYAIVATHNRQELVLHLTNALWEDGIVPIVIDNASNPPVATNSGVTLHDFEQPPNLSRLWNRGLSEACRIGPERDEFGIAVLNDDLVVYPGFVQELASGLGRDAAAAFTDGMVGCAYLLRGSLVRSGALRFDERFRWWCGDNDLEMQAHLLGGLRAVSVSGTVRHLYPGQQTEARPELKAQAVLDKEAFVEKWGRDPAWTSRLAQGVRAP